MPFETPSLPALIGRASTDLEGSEALRRTDAAVLARVHGAALYGLYQYLDWVHRQQFTDTADEENLLRRGRERGVLRKAPTPAAGPVLFTGTAGAAVPAGTRLEVGGVLFEVTEGGFIAGGAPIQVQAVDAGSAGNLPAGTQLNLVSPVLGVNSVATVGPDGVTGGTELEDLEAYRTRVAERYRVLPHGGNADDYERWAKDQPGITRAWCRRNWLGPGTVGVFVVNDAADPITPAAPVLAAVQAAIEPLRPVQAEVHVLAPALVPVPYKIGVTPDTPRVRAAVEAALAALHARSSELGGTLLRTHIGEAISGAAGEVDHDLQLPAADVVPERHQLLVYGGVTWV